MDIDERIAWEKEKAERRRIWEEQRKADAEQRERDEKQARLEAYLRRRGEAWMDHTRSLPPTGMIETWRAEYIAERVAEQELERERRLSLAEDIAGS